MLGFRPSNAHASHASHAQAHATTVRLSYSVVKSFPTLPIQQSKAVMITLSVVNHASVVSGAPMNVRLLAGSQSIHAPRLAQDWAIRMT
jgi:hypothetical protein